MLLCNLTEVLSKSRGCVESFAQAFGFPVVSDRLVSISCKGNLCQKFTEIIIINKFYVHRLLKLFYVSYFRSFTSDGYLMQAFGYLKLNFLPIYHKDFVKLVVCSTPY